MNPLLLALDTTHETGSLALLRGDAVIEELTLCSPTGFAHVIYGHIAALLARHGMALEAIDVFASASGPGSFTGVRVGLACIKGLAEAIAKPAVAVSNLRALAAFGAAPLRAAVLDARRGEVYGAVYDDRGRVVVGETVAPFAAWIETLPAAGEMEFIAQDFGFIEEPLAASRCAGAKRVTAPAALAAAVGRIAGAAYRRGEAQPPEALDANYVRRSDAELFWKDPA